MKDISGYKDRLKALINDKKDRQPARVAVNTLFSAKEKKALQSGNLSDTQLNMLLVIKSLNTLFFSLKGKSKYEKYWDKDVQEAFDEIRQINNDIITDIFLMSKSSNAKGIDAIIKMFNETYINNDITTEMKK